MEMPETLKIKPPAELENWFLQALEGDTLPLNDLLAVLRDLARQGTVEQADGLAELLTEMLLDAADADAVKRVLMVRAAWRMDSGYRDLCEKTLAAAFPSRLHKACITACGIHDGVPVPECLRRFDVLTRLEPGRFCFDGTWGFGVVQRMDDFYGRVTIDFDEKRGHQMTFAYAGETLRLVGEDHLLAVNRQDPERLRQWVREEPARVVRLALRDFGPMPAPILKETLVDKIVAEADWKRFWDAARKELKNDPLVDVPAKRNDPIRLREQEKIYDAAWFAGLEKARDPDAIWDLCFEFESQQGGEPLDKGSMGILADRIAFAVRATEDAQPDRAARLLMMADRLGIEDDALDMSRATRELMLPDRLVAAVEALPARETGSFLNQLGDCDEDCLLERLLGALPRFSAASLHDVIEFLVARSRREAVAERLRVLAADRSPEPEILIWLCTHPAEAAGWGITTPAELLAQALDLLESGQHAPRSRVLSRIRGCFENGEWIESMLAALDPVRREALLRRIHTSRAWDASSRRSVLAHFLKRYPELEHVLTESEGEAAVPGKQVTSWRSYRERSEQLKKLVEKDIPENSREIGVARSYGDLRENFEYQAAKDHQALLMAQKAELERDLERVQGTDFSNATTDKAGLGTRVVIERPDGRRERYHILGEWDRDEALGIISSNSKLARQMAGFSPGDRVTLPSERGEEPCRLVEVAPLGDDVRQWLR